MTAQSWTLAETVSTTAVFPFIPKQIVLTTWPPQESRPRAELTAAKGR